MNSRISDPQVLPPPPGIIGSLRVGFDVTAAHVSAILMPLALDLLIWLGPRLSMNQVAQPALKQFASMAETSGLQPTDLNAALDLYRQFFHDFNLLSVLRTFPIGISSLMSGRMPTLTPLGQPAVLQVDSPGHVLGLILVLTVAGWILGALYFHWVAGLVAARTTPQPSVSTSRAVLQTVLFSMVCVIVAWTLGLPIAVLVYIAFAINVILGEGVLLLLGFFALWLVVPLFFSPHGIFVRKQNAIASFVGSFQVMRFTLPTSSLFVLTVVLLGVGLNLLWSVPTGDSWLALVGILGHAFITTALLASSFVYYQDMTAWLQTVLARLRASMPTQRA